MAAERSERGAPGSFAAHVCARLRAIRRTQKLHQSVVADALGVVPSSISRRERGENGLRVSQLIAWTGSLGYRIDLVFYKDARSQGAFDGEPWLDDECAAILAEVASSLPHVPRLVRQSLVHQMRLWKQQATTQASPRP